MNYITLYGFGVILTAAAIAYHLGYPLDSTVNSDAMLVILYPALCFLWSISDIFKFLGINAPFLEMVFFMAGIVGEIFSLGCIIEFIINYKYYKNIE